MPQRVWKGQASFRTTREVRYFTLLAVGRKLEIKQVNPPPPPKNKNQQTTNEPQAPSVRRHEVGTPREHGNPVDSEVHRFPGVRACPRAHVPQVRLISSIFFLAPLLLRKSLVVVVLGFLLPLLLLLDKEKTGRRRGEEAARKARSYGGSFRKRLHCSVGRTVLEDRREDRSSL